MLSNNLLDYSVVKEPTGFRYTPCGGRIHQQCMVSDAGGLCRGAAGHPLLDDPISQCADTPMCLMVENTGLEPVTSGLQSRRSPN